MQDVCDAYDRRLVAQRLRQLRDTCTPFGFEFRGAGFVSRVVHLDSNNAMNGRAEVELAHLAPRQARVPRVLGRESISRRQAALVEFHYEVGAAVRVRDCSAGDVESAF